MCILDNIKMGMKLGSMISYIAAFTFFVIGLILGGKHHWSEAYGNTIAQAGGGLIFMSLLVLAAGCLIGYAGRQGNKFAAIVLVGLLTVLMIMHTSIGGVVLAATRSGDLSMSHEHLTECVSMYQPTPGLDCSTFINSDQYMGLKLLWKSYFGNLEDTDVEKLAEGRLWLFMLQKDAGCCGFGRPYRCQQDTREMPSGYPEEGPEGQNLQIYAYQGKNVRELCGKQINEDDTWYQACHDCDVPIPGEAFKYGGCPYEFPIGDCKLVVPNDRVKGCAAHVHKVIGSSVSSIGQLVLMFTILPAVVAFLTACLFAKRKANSEVMPATYPGLFTKKKWRGMAHAAGAGGSGGTEDDKDEDGVIMLQLAQMPADCMRAFVQLQKEAVAPTKNWDQMDLVNAVSKLQKENDRVWNNEVANGFTRLMRALDAADQLAGKK
jgi:hypothetical protein